MAKGKEKTKTKTVHSTALPYSDPTWPSISAECQTTILSLLLPLLQPIGQYTSAQSPDPKKSKRRTKRTQTQKTQDEAVVEHADRPAICSHLTIGFNSTIRKLEEVVSSTQTLEKPVTQNRDHQERSETPACPAVVFVCRAAFPAPVSESIPLLVAAASAHMEGLEPTRLVELSASAEAEISSALGLPRVSVLGLDESAPVAGPLLRYVRDQVERVNAPWLKRIPSSAYMPVDIISKEVVEGAQKRTRKRKADDG